MSSTDPPPPGPAHERRRASLVRGVVVWVLVLALAVWFGLRTGTSSRSERFTDGARSLDRALAGEAGAWTEAEAAFAEAARGTFLPDAAALYALGLVADLRADRDPGEELRDPALRAALLALAERRYGEGREALRGAVDPGPARALDELLEVLETARPSPR